MYYKIVSQDLFSISKYYNTTYCKPVQYKLGEYVYAANGTFLFIFNDLEKAKQAKKINGWIGDIYECEAEGVQIDRPEFLKNFGTTPDGTVFAYGVKLTKCVAVEPPRVIKDWYFVPTVEDSSSIITHVKEYDDGKCIDQYGTKTYKVTTAGIHSERIGMIGGTTHYHLNQNYNGYYLTNDKELADSLLKVCKAGIKIKD